MEPAEFRRHPRDGVQHLVMKLEAAIREAQEMRNSLLKQAGMTVTPDGLTIDSQLRVTGDTRIEGTLSLPAGIIDNEALANPLTYRSGYANFETTTVGTSDQTFAQFTMQVPPGFTRALIITFGQIGCRNTSGTPSAVACRVYVDVAGGDSHWGARRWVSAQPGEDVATFSTLFEAFDPLPTADELTFRLTALADHAWPNGGGGTIEAFAIFTR